MNRGDGGKRGSKSDGYRTTEGLLNSTKALQKEEDKYMTIKETRIQKLSEMRNEELISYHSKMVRILLEREYFTEQWQIASEMCDLCEAEMLRRMK